MLKINSPLHSVFPVMHECEHKTLNVLQNINVTVICNNSPPFPLPLPPNTGVLEIMAEVDEGLPLTDPFFAMEDESNINDRVLPKPLAQEEARPHQNTDQLVFSTPHRPRWRTEDVELVCVALAPSPLTTPHSTQHLLPLTPMRERRRVLLEGILPFLVQATTHHGGHPCVLVCPPLRRNVGAGMWLHQAEMVCGSVVASSLSYKEGSEVVCGGVGWGRTAQNLSHQTSNATGPSSVVWNNLAAMDTRPHTTHHYIPHLSPRRTTTPNAPVAVNAHFSHKYHSSEERECTSNSRIPREAVGDPPPTQQLVTGMVKTRVM